MGVSGPSCVVALLRARGVEPLASLLASEEATVSPVCGVSIQPADRWPPPLRGVPRLMVNLRLRPPELDGMTISDSGCAPSDASMESCTPCLVRLSLRRCSSVFSPRTARARASPPAELAWEVAIDTADSGSLATEVTAGDCDLGGSGSSVQLAGVGGTGPKAVTPLGGGRLVGGDIMGAPFSPALDTLCDREDGGGGPGGGGGRGIWPICIP